MSDERNPLRVYMLRNIIAQNPEAPITVEGLAGFLPDNFALDDDDLAEFRPTPAEVEFEAAPESAIAAEPTPAPEPEAEAAPDTPTINPDEARERMRVLHEQLAQARGAVMSLTSDQRHARDRLAQSIAAFVNGFTPMTREQLVAEEIRRGREQAKAERQSRPGKSYIDRAAFYGRDNSPEGHVRSNLQYGNRRGAMPASMRGKFDPRYAQHSMPLVESVKHGAVAKLPSQR